MALCWLCLCYSVQHVAVALCWCYRCRCFQLVAVAFCWSLNQIPFQHVAVALRWLLCLMRPRGASSHCLQVDFRARCHGNSRFPGCFYCACPLFRSCCCRRFGHLLAYSLRRWPLRWLACLCTSDPCCQVAPHARLITFVRYCFRLRAETYFRRSNCCCCLRNCLVFFHAGVHPA